MSVDDRFEAALRQLTPAPPTFAKERVAFLAGKALGRLARWRLALLTAFLGVAMGMAGTYLALHTAVPAQPPPQVIVIHVPAPAAVVPAPPETNRTQEPQPSAPATSDQSISAGWLSLFQSAIPASGYLQLRDQALRWGVEALPTPAATTTAGPVPATSLLKLQSESIGRASDF